MFKKEAGPLSPQDREAMRAVRLEAQPEKSLFAALEAQDVVLEAGCSGKGRCGRCRVKYLSAAPLPCATERRFFSAQELRAGMRLACLHPVKGACRVEPMYVQPARVQIVTEMPEPESGADSRRNKTAAENCGADSRRNKAAAEPGAVSGRDTRKAESGSGCAAALSLRESGWCIAIDLGTTTIAMQARRLTDGAVLGVWKAMNPQRRYGSDVISRMQAANEGQTEKLKSVVETVLIEGIRELCRTVESAQEDSAASDGLKGIYLAGNTVMEHLLAGLSVDRLSRHPFCPVTLEEQSISLDSHTVTLLPGFSAFVGADLLAGVFACGMHQRDEISLLIDLGTNGEIVLGNRERLLCTATAAGPAFEGGPGNPAPGTDMIAVIAELMDARIVDGTGLMAEPWFENGISWVPGKGPASAREAGVGVGQQLSSSREADIAAEQRTVAGAGAYPEASARTVRMTQEQIRAIQMAKAAVYAGICILTKEYGITLADVSRVYLAGGFGYYLNVEKAAQIGLFPDELKERVTAVGNTSLKGAFIYGRNADKEEAGRIRKICTAINLAEHEDFETIYLEHLNLE